MPTVHAPTFFSQPVQRISARTSSSWITGGHAPDAWDMNPSLVEEAQKQDSLATEPSDLGCAAADCLATCKKCGMKSRSIPSWEEARNQSHSVRKFQGLAAMFHHALHFPHRLPD